MVLAEALPWLLNGILFYAEISFIKVLSSNETSHKLAYNK